MVVHRDDRPFADVAAQFGDALGDLLGQEDAYGVGDVDGARTRFDGGVDDLFHEAHFAASRVFEAELHVLDESPGVLYGVDGAADHFVGFHAQFVLHVDGARGDEGVDALFGCGGDGFSRGFDVSFDRPGQGADGGVFDPLGDAGDGVEIPGACRGESRFDDVDAQLLELHGDLDFLLGVHARTGALLSVAEGRIEDNNAFFTHWFAFEYLKKS